MTHVPRETVTCSSCGQTFDRIRSKPLPPGILRELQTDHLAAMCGDCHKLFMDWLDKKPTN